MLCDPETKVLTSIIKHSQHTKYYAWWRNESEGSVSMSLENKFSGFQKLNLVEVKSKQQNLPRQSLADVKWLKTFCLFFFFLFWFLLCSHIGFADTLYLTVSYVSEAVYTFSFSDVIWIDYKIMLISLKNEISFRSISTKTTPAFSSVTNECRE